MKNQLSQLNRKGGFTLVEIMIVVVIIGILAVLAIPAFQTVRNNTIERTIVNDGRLIGASLQQAFMEGGDETVALATEAAADGNPGSWTIQGDSTALYDGNLSQGVVLVGAGDISVTDGTFTLRHPQYDNSNSRFSEDQRVLTDGLRFNVQGQVAAEGEEE